MTRGTQLDRLPGGEGRRGGSRSQGAAPAPAPELPSCRPGADGPPGLPADPAEGGSGPPRREVPLPALHRPGCQAPGPLAGVPPAREGAAAGDSQASVALACPEEASAQSRRTPLSSKAYAYVPAAVPTAEARAPRRSRQAPRARCGQWQDPTTVMMRNLPYCYTRKRLIDLFDSLGFSGKYDFFYLPIDFATGYHVGYAFLNLTAWEHAVHFMEVFTGFSDWKPKRDHRICAVSWGAIQGFHANVERFEISQMTMPGIPEDYKPVLFWDGVQISLDLYCQAKKVISGEGDPSQLGLQVSAVFGGQVAEKMLQ